MLMSIPIWSAKLPVSQYERILSISGDSASNCLAVAAGRVALVLSY